MQWLGIVVHHSASHDVDANTIDRWHREKGWAGVGYHFVIRFDGSIEPARDWKAVGAHAYGRNSTHLGICLTGNFNQHSPTEEQLRSLMLLVRGLQSRFGIKSVEQHHEECPGKLFPWAEFIQELENLKGKEE